MNKTLIPQPDPLQNDTLYVWRKSFPWFRLVIIIVVAILLLAALAVRHVSRLLIAKHGEHSAASPKTTMEAVKAFTQVAFNPRAGFPHQNQINVLVMGIDDNWTDQNILYTKDARTDTMFLLTLDLNNKKASTLSIPRDSYVPIAGTNYSDKINSAYATGGPVRAVATFAQLTGVYPQYYVVLNIDATKRLVNALGGVDVNVEHQMDYDDNWGHLHVHLKPGFQHLDGDEALSFIRYRHSNHGLAVEDGDPRRTYRQQVLLRGMINRAKTVGAAINSDELINTAMGCINTNLSRTQIADLAHLFQGLSPTDVTTVQIIGADARGNNGAWLIQLDPIDVKDYVDWLVHGRESEVWNITPVDIKVADGDSRLACDAVSKLKTLGFDDITVGNSSSTAGPSIVDTGVQDPHAAHAIAQVLGIDQSAVVRRPNQPNKSGWTLPSQINVIVGTQPELTNMHRSS